MLFDPKIGMRVRWARQNIGTVVSLEHSALNIISIKLDDPFRGNYPIYAYLSDLEILDMSPEEEIKYKEFIRQEHERKLDQQRRQSHADKYL